MPNKSTYDERCQKYRLADISEELAIRSKVNGFTQEELDDYEQGFDGYREEAKLWEKICLHPNIGSVLAVLSGASWAASAYLNNLPGSSTETPMAAQHAAYHTNGIAATLSIIAPALLAAQTYVSVKNKNERKKINNRARQLTLLRKSACLEYPDYTLPPSLKNDHEEESLLSPSDEVHELSDVTTRL